VNRPPPPRLVWLDWRFRASFKASWKVAPMRETGAKPKNKLRQPLDDGRRPERRS
jgi:hypothetical protein